MKCPKCKTEIPDKEIRAYIGSINGKKSRRTITPEQQAKMQAWRKREKAGENS